MCESPRLTAPLPASVGRPTPQPGRRDVADSRVVREDGAPQTRPVERPGNEVPLLTPVGRYPRLAVTGDLRSGAHVPLPLISQTYEKLEGFRGRFGVPRHAPGVVPSVLEAPPPLFGPPRRRLVVGETPEGRPGLPLPERPLVPRRPETLFAPERQVVLGDPVVVTVLHRHPLTLATSGPTGGPNDPLLRSSDRW